MKLIQFCGVILFTSTGRIASTHLVPVALHLLGDEAYIKNKVKTYMRDHNIDSTELISCVITSDAVSMTTDSIFEPEKESEYLPETVNTTNQQYDEYVSTMFQPQNQPISGE